MNAADLLILFGLLAAVALVFFWRKKSARKGCGGCCAACTSACGKAARGGENGSGKKGRTSLPKGHAEAGESEEETQ